MALDESHIFLYSGAPAPDGSVESQGLAILEAQASGLPVVATDVGGIPDGLPPEASDFLVPAANVDALTGAIERMMDAPERWPALGQAGRRLVENRFGVSGMTDAFEAVYREATGQ